jgi:23S rRNA (cytidine1920-2'-O)/16S rRNA (cytidine1409-2'-O)-methyltransferase
MTASPERERLDKLLIEQGWAKSRPRAERLIVEFGVKVDGELVKKPGKRVSRNAKLQPMGEEMPWVGRGAYKLLAALEHWSQIELKDRVVLDVGSSTGGFTQVCLNQGARGVCAVDTGRDQLDSSLRADDRIALFEQTNVLHLKPEDILSAFNQLADLAVVDVSFVSSTLLFPVLPTLLLPDGQVILLVKPQFEVGPTGLGRNGIVRSNKLRNQAVKKVELAALQHGAQVIACMESPVVGGDGNIEFLMWLRFPSSQSA